MLQALARPFPKKHLRNLLNGSSSASMSDCALNEEDMPHSIPPMGSPTTHLTNRSRPSSRSRSEPDMDISAPPPPPVHRERTRYHKTSRGITEKGSSHAERQPSIEGERVMKQRHFTSDFLCVAFSHYCLS